MATLETPLRRLRSCPLAIICGKPEEIPAIAKKLDASDVIHGASVDGVNNGHIFYLGKIQFKGEKILRFYVTSSLKQGLVHFSIHASALFSILRPRYAIHAGVCAGNQRQGIQLEDVICGDHAMCFEEGKWGMKSEQLTFMPNYETVGCTIAALPTFASDKGKVHYGPFISGSAVRQDAPKIFELIESTVNYKVLALEMEASAFLKLCQHSEHAGVNSLGVIKGVSDLGDENKPRDSVVYNDALEATGGVVKDWISFYFRSMTWEPDENNETGAHIARPYYQNYVRLIADAIAARRQIRNLDTNAIENGITGMQIVMPPNDDPSYFAEQGQLERIVQSFRLSSVTIDEGSFRRTLHHKRSYLIDFPRCLNELINAQEPRFQVAVFKRFLQQQPYLRDSQQGTSFVQLLTWEEFQGIYQL